MTDRELMQMALDALSMAVEPKKGKVYAFEFQPIDCDAMYLKAIEALRARLEKWTVKDMAYRPNGLPQSEQELVAWSRNLSDGQLDLAAVGEVGIWGERQWQGLTDAEIRGFEIWLDDEEEKHGWNPPADIVKYIEAKLKGKNT